jgi:hypothetical protein
MARKRGSRNPADPPPAAPVEAEPEWTPSMRAMAESFKARLAKFTAAYAPPKIAIASGPPVSVPVRSDLILMAEIAAALKALQSEPALMAEIAATLKALQSEPALIAEIAAALTALQSEPGKTTGRGRPRNHAVAPATEAAIDAFWELTHDPAAPELQLHGARPFALQAAEYAAERGLPGALDLEPESPAMRAIAEVFRKRCLSRPR